MGRSIDHTGRRYGRLTVLRQDGVHVSPSGCRSSMWVCLCDCGSLTRTRGTCLSTGNSRSCGCLQREVAAQLKGTHRLSQTPTYKSWLGMMHRCYRPKEPKFGLYGGRGIIVCEKWHDFLAFLADMGLRPAKHSLDRIDSNGNYEPENCRWADIFTQNRNKRTNVRVMYEGREMVLSEAARVAGLKPATVRNRRFNGWPEWAWFYPEGTRRANLPEYG